MECLGNMLGLVSSLKKKVSMKTLNEGLQGHLFIFFFGIRQRDILFAPESSSNRTNHKLLV